jgi:hypothetical protein
MRLKTIKHIRSLKYLCDIETIYNLRDGYDVFAPHWIHNPDLWHNENGRIRRRYRLMYRRGSQNFQSSQGHASINFFAAKTSYIKKLVNPNTLQNYPKFSRLDYEMWLGIGAKEKKLRVYQMCDGREIFYET